MSDSDDAVDGEAFTAVLDRVIARCVLLNRCAARLLDLHTRSPLYFLRPSLCRVAMSPCTPVA